MNEVGTRAVDGWAVTFGTARRGLGLAVPNVTAHPSTASVPVVVLLYNGPLLCGFITGKCLQALAGTGKRGHTLAVPGKCSPLQS